jgi:hypothetical protein
MFSAHTLLPILAVLHTVTAAPQVGTLSVTAADPISTEPPESSEDPVPAGGAAAAPGSVFIALPSPDQATTITLPNGTECTGTIAECLPMCAKGQHDPATWVIGDAMIAPWIRDHWPGGLFNPLLPSEVADSP